MTNDGRPALRIVRGDPSPEQVAALVAVLSARSRAAAAARDRAADRTRRPRSVWRDPARLLRGETRRGPGAWRRSAWPR